MSSKLPNDSSFDACITKREPKNGLTSRDFSINSGHLAKTVAHDRNVVLFVFVVLFNSCCICDVCLCASMWRHGPFD